MQPLLQIFSTLSCLGSASFDCVHRLFLRGVVSSVGKLSARSKNVRFCRPPTSSPLAKLQHYRSAATDSFAYSPARCTVPTLCTLLHPTLSTSSYSTPSNFPPFPTPSIPGLSIDIFCLPTAGQKTAADAILQTYCMFVVRLAKRTPLGSTCRPFCGSQRNTSNTPLHPLPPHPVPQPSIPSLPLSRPVRLRGPPNIHTPPWSPRSSYGEHSHAHGETCLHHPLVA